MKTISNRQLTLLRKLNQKKYREKEQLFTVEGERAVEQVIDNGTLEIEMLCFDEGRRLWQQQRWQTLSRPFDSCMIEADDFSEVTDTDTPQGVMAVCNIPEPGSFEELAQTEGVIVAVDRIRDPGNLGTIVRTAAWFGCRGLLLGKGTVDLFHPKVVRGTAGATGAVPYRNSKLEDDLSDLEKQDWQIVLLDASDDGTHLRRVPEAARSVVVIGNEAGGVQPSLYTGSRIRARIDSPVSSSRIESLNAAIALSIALYELSG